MRPAAFGLALCLLTSLSAHAAPVLEVAVTGSGPPLILIPGLGCDGDVWTGTVAHYRKRRTLHVVTIAGFAGRPAAAPGPLLPAVATELAAYLRAHAADHPVLVGHSLGGVVALLVAADNPGLLGGVVVLDALPFLPAAGDASLTAALARPQAEQVRTMLAGMTPEAWTAQNRAALEAMITVPADVARVAERSSRSAPAAIAQAVYDLMTLDLRARLGDIQAPVLVLAAASGGDPAMVRSVYEAQYARLRGQRYTLRLAERARHFIMLDDAATFHAALDAFLVGRGRS